jgi:hypothetical protein
MTRLLPIMVICLLFSALRLEAQSPDYIVKKGQDTTFCLSVEVRHTGGEVTKINYTNMAGRYYTVSGKRDCEDIITFCINGQVFDLIPMKASQPGSNKRHVWRKIDGRIKLYDYYKYISGTEEGTYIKGSEGYVIQVFSVLLDDMYFEVNDETIEETIKPYLLKCGLFANRYTGDFSDEKEVFEQIIKFFNYLCPEQEEE